MKSLVLCLLLCLGLCGCSSLNFKHKEMIDLVPLPPECPTHSKQKAWAKLPTTYSFSKDFPENAKPAIRRAINRWNEAFIFNVFILKEDSAESLNVFYWDTQKDYNFEPDSLAETSIYSSHETGIIERADIHINASGFNFSFEHPPKPYEFDLEDVAVHELGHSLGLDHSVGGTMVPRTQVGDWNTNITHNANRAIRCIYQNHHLEK